MLKVKSDIEIAREASLKPVGEIAQRLDIPAASMIPYGHTKAKVDLDFIDSLSSRQDGKLILVTAITPTPAGEGKTTTTVGLGDGLNRIGVNAMVCLREPSLGPCFGMKGGAAGGGYAQVVPMEDINLHFTGDFHAIGTAHNLLSALVDNSIYWGSDVGLDSRRVAWRRVVDMNDRALRQVVCSLGGVSNGFARESGFDITVASEIMAIFCLAENLQDLERRLGNIIVGYRRDRSSVAARELNGHGPMTVLLKDAFAPNLVQTLENNPAFVHGGPFANIAHGCNSVVATKAALKLTDYVITEAGFGADLGAQKFFDIKCRTSGLEPSAVVVVATIRALKMHGGVSRTELGIENVAAVEAGCVNLEKHLENVAKYGLPAIVAINRFVSDTDAEVEVVRNSCETLGANVAECTHWSDGGAGTEALAHRVVELADSGTGSFKPLYPNELSLADKIRTTAQQIYGAADIAIDSKAAAYLKQLESDGFAHLPVCMAKTQYSFSVDPTALGAPKGHIVPIREVRLLAGAGFVVAICGDIMTMPGLPRVPAANAIRLGNNGQIEGLF
ncbi:MAG: formate--tetrahydrofolate ligase [Acidiferrobacterales bacterium]|nr:formate--tetrahydrofolate ligase [Acidiferrobacterales bacterium]